MIKSVPLFQKLTSQSSHIEVLWGCRGEWIACSYLYYLSSPDNYVRKLPNYATEQLNGSLRLSSGFEFMGHC